MNYIINPITNKKVNLFVKEGKEILKQYILRYFIGGTTFPTFEKIDEKDFSLNLIILDENDKLIMNEGHHVYNSLKQKKMYKKFIFNINTQKVNYSTIIDFYFYYFSTTEKEINEIKKWSTQSAVDRGVFCPGKDDCAIQTFNVLFNKNFNNKTSLPRNLEDAKAFSGILKTGIKPSIFLNKQQDSKTFFRINIIQTDNKQLTSSDRYIKYKKYIADIFKTLIEIGTIKENSKFFMSLFYTDSGHGIFGAYTVSTKRYRFGLYDVQLNYGSIICEGSSSKTYSEAIDNMVSSLPDFKEDETKYNNPAYTFISSYEIYLHFFYIRPQEIKIDNYKGIEALLKKSYIDFFEKNEKNKIIWDEQIKNINDLNINLNLDLDFITLEKIDNIELEKIDNITINEKKNIIEGDYEIIKNNENIYREVVLIEQLRRMLLKCFPTNRGDDIISDKQGSWYLLTTKRSKLYKINDALLGCIYVIYAKKVKVFMLHNICTLSDYSLKGVCKYMLSNTIISIIDMLNNNVTDNDNYYLKLDVRIGSVEKKNLDNNNEVYLENINYNSINIAAIKCYIQCGFVFNLMPSSQEKLKTKDEFIDFFKKNLNNNTKDYITMETSGDDNSIILFLRMTLKINIGNNLELLKKLSSIKKPTKKILNQNEPMDIVVEDPNEPMDTNQLTL